MIKKPIISVVMPIYNSQTYLSESIESVLSQKFQNFEFIIIDDGSTDNGTDIIKSYNDSRIKLYCKTHNYIKSLNWGISVSQGEYIARMDADDIMMPHRLEMQYRYMESNPDIDICGSWAETFGNSVYIIKSLTDHNDIFSSLLFNNPMVHPTVMMRKKSLEKISIYPNLYKQRFIYAEDYKLWVDFAVKGLKFSNIPDILLKYRFSETQNTSKYSTRMSQTTNLIQAQYLEFIINKIVHTDSDYYNFLGHAVNLLEQQKLSNTDVKQLVFNIAQKIIKV